MKNAGILKKKGDIMDRGTLADRVNGRLSKAGVRDGAAPRDVAQHLIAALVEQDSGSPRVSLDDVKRALVDAVRAARANPCRESEFVAA